MAGDDILIRKERKTAAESKSKTSDATTQEKCDIKEPRRIPAYPKVYCIRNSPLTDLMEINHFRSVLNMCIAIVFLVFSSAVFYYYALPDKFFRDMSAMSWATGGLKAAFAIWTGMHMAVLFILYPAVSYWSRIRSRFNTKVVDIFFLILWIIFLILMFVISLQLTIAKKIPIITCFAFLNEQVRIIMKSYSFVREIAQKIINKNPRISGENSQAGCLSISKLIYFLFAPCLLYRDSYPRTKVIRWSFVLWHLLQMFACIFILHCLFSQINMVVLRKAALEETTLEDFALVPAFCFFGGSLTIILCYYMFLHCWMNACAEMMRFGDRMFYQDWWNCTTYSGYFRKWNIIVYDWIFTYVYLDLYKISGNKFASNAVVYILSSVIHEYILTFAFGFFYPVLFTSFTFSGVVFPFLSKRLPSKFWNAFIWFTVFFGWGLLVYSYSVEWYARANL